VIQFFLREVAKPIFDFVYPPVCSVCGRGLQDEDRFVCRTCWLSVPRIHERHPIWQELGGRVAQSSTVSDFTSCFLFEKDGALQTILHLLKYNEMSSIGLLLGRELAGPILENGGMREADCLLPVPLHKLKRRERGYNQADFICRGVSTVTGIPAYPQLLIRKRFTSSQTKLNSDERKKNVSEAFVVNPKFRSAVDGTRIIIVDDVITTGSTIFACAQELQRAGARAIYAASVALAQ
jgi:ComF family protein